MVNILLTFLAVLFIVFGVMSFIAKCVKAIHGHYQMFAVEILAVSIGVTMLLTL